MTTLRQIETYVKANMTTDIKIMSSVLGSITQMTCKFEGRTWFFLKAGDMNEDMRQDMKNEAASKIARTIFKLINLEYNK